MRKVLQRFNSLLGQARAGSEPAARELVEQFTPFIQRVVRSRLNKRLRRVYDSADFSQAVWTSFFALLPEEHDFQEPAELVKFLERVARNKVVEKVRRRLGTRNQKMRRVIPLENSDKLIGPSPTASQEAIAEERWQRALDKQPEHHEILNSFRGGLSQSEIAERLGISERTVRRAIRRLQLGLE